MHPGFMSVVLIGYRGSGKTTVGQALARRLAWPFVDADAVVVDRAGMSIRDIFARYGEPHFRSLEATAVAELLARRDHVIALGGGAVLSADTRAAMAAAGHRVVYLRGTPDEFHRRIAADPATADTRPNLTAAGGAAEVQVLLTIREPIYRSVATHEVDVVGGSVDALAEQLACWCRTQVAAEAATPGPLYLNRQNRVSAGVYPRPSVVNSSAVLQLLPFVIFVFLLGACVGSFLNVVVWRLPRIELPERCGPVREAWLTVRGLSDPPSHCPKCGNRLKWYDNLPIVGWIKLGGRCRFCREPISVRYPLVEALTAALFAAYFWAYYGLGWRACGPAGPAGWDLNTSWPIFGLYAFTVAALLAASLIDLELYLIPPLIPWVVAAVAFPVHAIVDTGRRCQGH